jgi:hypothetical protein
MGKGEGVGVWLGNLVKLFINSAKMGMLGLERGGKKRDDSVTWYSMCNVGDKVHVLTCVMMMIQTSRRKGRSHPGEWMKEKESDCEHDWTQHMLEHNRARQGANQSTQKSNTIASDSAIMDTYLQIIDKR